MENHTTIHATPPSSDDPKTPLLPLQTHNHNNNNDNNYSFLRLLITRKNLCILSGPLACTLICLLVNIHGNVAGRNMLGVLVWIFLWWLTDALPMPVTSMAPLFLYPLFGIATADQVAKSYMDDVISLVLGTFILALAVERYHIHRRLALNITLMFCGDTTVNTPMFLLGICATTAFVSMWMHNTAAAMMMMPVATGILQRFPEAGSAAAAAEGGQQQLEVEQFSKAVVLGVIYSAAIGGMSTLTGTGVNLLLAGMWQSYFPEQKPISFSSWFFFGFPLALVIFFAMWTILCSRYCSKNSGKVLSKYLDRAHLKRELDSLGHMAFAEKVVLTVFALLVVLWMTRSLTNEVPGWGALFHGNVGDGTVSVMMATLLFIIPNKKDKGEMLMDWKVCKNLPWNIVLLLGAGFAIADGVRTTGLTEVLSAGLNFLESAPYLAIAPLVCLISSTITEFTSNNSTTMLVVPLLIELAASMRLHPLLLMVPGAIGAQFAFLLPTGTPSNVVGFSTGEITIMDMIKMGLPLKIAGIATLSVLMPTLGAFVFNTNCEVGLHVKL